MNRQKWVLMGIGMVLAAGLAVTAIRTFAADQPAAATLCKQRVVFLFGQASLAMKTEKIDGYNSIDGNALPCLIEQGWRVKSIELSAELSDGKSVGYALLEHL